MKHTQSQETAIHHVGGPMLVLAGPGSGKTYVITERILYLTQVKEVAPDNLLVVTFTKAAADEMKQRYLKRSGDRSTTINFGTFHSIFFQILRYAYHYQPSNILREDQKQQFFREIIRKLSIDNDDEKELIRDIETEISLVKGNEYTLATYYPMSITKDGFQYIYTAYERFLHEHCLIDFDDMMLYCKELFEQRTDILKKWQEHFQYIMVDEFQDINQLQYKILKMLASPRDNLFVVGDDDQSIYQFRGAKPEYMLNFAKEYPQADTVLLNHNFRCSQSILKAASTIIGHNRVRFNKELEAVRGQGEAVSVQGFETLNLQNEAIVKALLQQEQKGTKWKQMAVLARTNAQFRNLMGKLMAYNIPFQSKDVVPNLFEHWIARDILAYLHMGAGDRKRATYLTVINRPNRYISRDVLDTPEVDFQRLCDYYEGKEWMQERVEQLEYDVQFLSGMQPYAAIRYIRKGIGYDDYIQDYAKQRRISVDELFEVLEELQESARECKTLSRWEEQIESYREEWNRKQQKRRRRGERLDGVNLMTMHAAKGLEFTFVWIPDVNEEIVPYQKAITEDELEEERRMLYVAMTRAKDHLIMSYVKQRYNKELMASRFLKEMESCVGKMKNT